MCDVYTLLILKDKMGLCYNMLCNLHFFTVIFNRYPSVYIHRFISLFNCYVVCHSLCVCVCLYHICVP